jgi:Phosphoenolpyruvate synthase/pyruvate phosphate dikinase
MVREGLIDKKEAVARIVPARSTSCCIPRSIPRRAQGDRQGAAGLAGCCIRQGGVLGRRGGEAGARRREGDPGAARDQPEDIHGMHAAEGILTSTGGMTSHAAVVARGMGKPCVAGAGDVRIDGKAGTLSVRGTWSRPASS